MWPAPPGYGAGYGYDVRDVRHRRRDREESSESRGRQRRRRRDEEEDDKRDRRDSSKADKKGKKDSKKDSKEDGGRRDSGREADGRDSDRKRDRDGGAVRDSRDGRRDGGDRDRKTLADITPRSKGGDAKDAPRKNSGGVEKESDAKKAKKEEKPDKDKEKQKEQPPAEELESKKSKNWREEVKEDEDERDLSTDEEAAEKKLAEARRRREAIAAAAKAKAAAAKKDDEAAGDCSQAGDAAKVSLGSPDGDKPERAGSENGALDAGLQSPDQSAEGRASATEKKDGLASAASGRSTQKMDEKTEADGTSMFDDSAKAGEELRKGMAAASQNIGLTGASGEDWDDEEGYYIPKIGEVMDNQYLVVETSSGKGVFSNVVKAKDQKDPDQQLVAVKILRANDMMTKAAEKEIQILEMLKKTAHPKRPCHIVKLLSTFAYRKHFCLVFECMWDDMRAALKKYTKNRGMSLQAVKAYTQQLFHGLKHMHSCKIVHADIKPDNILISKDHRIVKFCDLGTAVELKDVGVTPYLASRFYRAPEIILGVEYTQSVDTWALGCTLYELFTGKVLFQSKSNNDHLRKIMEYKGKIPVKVIKKGFVWKNHFTEEMDFKHVVDSGNVSGETVTKTITKLNASKSIKDLVLERVGTEKRQSQAKEDQEYVKKATQFADLLEQMLALDPEKRIKPDEAFSHPFLQESKKSGEKRQDR